MGFAMIRHLFVYGTLRTGDVRWPFLRPFVRGAGIADTVPGSLFDTGFDYPAAVFDRAGNVVGQTFELDVATIDRALDVLDAEEDTVGGLYRRVVVTTGSGVEAWAYEYGAGLDLVPIPSGDWMIHRPF